MKSDGPYFFGSPLDKKCRKWGKIVKVSRGIPSKIRDFFNVTDFDENWVMGIFLSVHKDKMVSY